ncbi:hypothetical protein BDU57DRAFT_457190, partial [Ampelomyces quisqualis]
SITDKRVDESQKKAVLRASFFVVAMRAQSQVENDLLWMLEMDSEGKRDPKSLDIVDGTGEDN